MIISQDTLGRPIPLLRIMQTTLGEKNADKVLSPAETAPPNSSVPVEKAAKMPMTTPPSLPLPQLRPKIQPVPREEIDMQQRELLKVVGVLFVPHGDMFFMLSIQPTLLHIIPLQPTYR